MNKIESYLVKLNTSLRDAIASIDVNGKGIVLVVDNDRKLLGTISDGDVRRAILQGVSLDLTVESLLAERIKIVKHGPITVLREHLTLICWN